jgi:hypothetical protein
MFHVKHVHIRTCNRQPKSFGKNREKPAIFNAIVPVATETRLVTVAKRKIAVKTGNILRFIQSVLLDARVCIRPHVSHETC